MNRAFEKAAQSSATDFANGCILELATKYSFDAAEAMTYLGMDQVTVKKAASRKKGEGKVKSPKSLTVLIKRETPSIPLPWCGTAHDEWCNGLRLNHNLHSQCCMEPINGGEFCKTCQKQADSNANGKPTYGSVTDRLAVDLLEYRDPKQNKQTVPYANVMQKLNITRAAAETEASKFGMTIPEEHFVIRESKRGRPKKDASVSDSDSDGSTSSVLAKKRGRPKKDKKVIAASVGDDLITQLIAQSSSPVVAVVAPVVAVNTEAVNTEAVTKISPVNDEAAKAKRKADKQAKLSTLVIEYSTLSSKVGVSVLNKTPTKIGELQKAILSLKRQLKEKETEDALKASLAVEEKEEVIESDDDSDSNSDDDENSAIKVVRFETPNGSKYLKNADNVLYDIETQKAIGVWDSANDKIMAIEDLDDFDDNESDEDDG